MPWATHDLPLSRVKVSRESEENERISLRSVPEQKTARWLKLQRTPPSEQEVLDFLRKREEEFSLNSWDGLEKLYIMRFYIEGIGWTAKAGFSRNPVQRYRAWCYSLEKLGYKLDRKRSESIIEGHLPEDASRELVRRCETACLHAMKLKFGPPIIGEEIFDIKNEKAVYEAVKILGEVIARAQIYGKEADVSLLVGLSGK